MVCLHRPACCMCLGMIHSGMDAYVSWRSLLLIRWDCVCYLTFCPLETGLSFSSGSPPSFPMCKRWQCCAIDVLQLWDLAMAQTVWLALFVTWRIEGFTSTIICLSGAQEQPNCTEQNFCYFVFHKDFHQTERRFFQPVKLLLWFHLAMLLLAEKPFYNLVHLLWRDLLNSSIHFIKS